MAGSKKDTFENAFLLLLFNNMALANIGNAGGLQPSTVAGSFYVALFSGSASDSVAGTEISYTGYSRVAVVRTSAGWTVNGNSVSNAALITFGLCTAGSVTATQFAICKAGTRDIDDAIYWGDLTAPLAISTGVTPEIAIGGTGVTED